MKRRDLLTGLLILPLASLAAGKPPRVEAQPKGEPYTRYFPVEETMKTWGKLNVYLDGNDVGWRCAGMSASPSPGLEVDGWCELLVEQKPSVFAFDDDGNLMTEIHHGAVWWEPVKKEGD